MNFIEVPICSYQAYQQNQAYFPDWEIGMKLGFFRLQTNKNRLGPITSTLFKKFIKLLNL